MSTPHIPPTEAELDSLRHIHSTHASGSVVLVELIDEIRRLRKLCGEAAYAAEHFYFTEDLRERLDRAAKGRI
jgi:hypothetical protein